MAETYSNGSMSTQEWWRRSQEKTRAANEVRRSFTDDINSGRLGRCVMAFDVSSIPIRADIAFQEAAGYVDDEHELVIGGMIQGTEDYDVLQTVTSPDDIRSAQGPFEGGVGKLYIHAIPAGSYDDYRQRLRAAGL